MGGDPTAARRWAGLALRRFRARGNHAWAALAELTRLRAAFAADTAVGAMGAVAGRRGARPRTAGSGSQAEELAGRLRAHGLPKDAVLAELIAARAFTVARRPRRRGALPGARPADAACRLRWCCCGGSRGQSWPRPTAGPAPRWLSCEPGWPPCTPAAVSWAASTCRPERQRSAPNWPASGCGWPSAAARPGTCSRGWNGPARRPSASIRSGRPRTRRRRRCWPSCASSAS